MTSIGLSSCFHNEPDALPGFLECAAQFFDELVLISAPPPGVEHCQESIAIIEKFGAKLILSTVEQGFGVLRTQCIWESSCEWVAILDCDERLFPVRRTMTCVGTEKYPENPNPNCVVNFGTPFNQGAILRSMLDCAEGFDALVMPRYHFMDFSMKQACQNFCDIKDFQCRVVRNAPHIAYRPERKMHELIVDTRTGAEPNMIRQEPHAREIAICHFHVPFKKMDTAKNRKDMATYQALDKNLTTEMWLNASL